MTISTPVPPVTRYRVHLPTGLRNDIWTPDAKGDWCLWSEVDALLLQRAQEIATLRSMSEMYRRSFQAALDVQKRIAVAIDDTPPCETVDQSLPSLVAFVVEERRKAEAQLTAQAQEIAQVQAEKEAVEQWLRLEWWMNHGHDGLYGDDGEMQCGKCRPVWDYRREPIAALKEHVEKVRLEQLAAKLKGAEAALVSRAPQPEQEP